MTRPRIDGFSTVTAFVSDLGPWAAVADAIGWEA